MAGLDYIHPTALGEVGAAAAAVMMLGNTSQLAFNFSPKWLVLMFAIIIASVVEFASLLPIKIGTEDPNIVVQLIFVILNGALIFLTAVGSNSVASVSPATAPVDPELGGKLSIKRSFWAQW